MINVVFSTYNGENTLPLMLDAFQQLIPPNGGWKILAVDNASTDNARQIIESYQNTLPIQYLYEEKQGKNNALNAALEIIDGELTVFTDDDIIPSPDWLIKLVECAEERSDYNVFTGKILPFWMQEPSELILNEVALGVVYTLSDDSRQSGDVGPFFLSGPNMMIRKSIFDAGIRFNGAIGPSSDKSYAMGSETELSVRLSEAGHKLYYCNDATVQHIIRPFQMQTKWILNRAFRLGRGRFVLEFKDQIFNRNIAGIPFWLISQLLKDMLSFIGFFIHFNKKYWYFHKVWDLKFTLGQIYAAHQR